MMGKVINFGSGKNDIKAYAVFDGENGSIIESKNILSLVRLSKGIFEITFNIPFKNKNYIIVGSDVGSTKEGYHSALVSNGVEKKPDKCQFKFVNDNGAVYDLDCLQVFFIGE